MDTFNPNQMPPLQMYGGPEKRSMGPMIAVIVILALIVIGGLYFLKERSGQRVYIPIEQPEQSGSPEELAASEESAEDAAATSTETEALENPDQAEASE